MIDYIKQRTVVDESTGCWEWTQNKTSQGYGNATFKTKTWKAHRLSYTAFIGDIPEGLVVMHSCDNPSCCNPQHLSVGTQKDNMDDMVRKGRSNIGHTHNQGSKCGVAKLKEEDVLKIKELLAKGVSQREIAEKYNVKQPTISQINTGTTWSHLCTIV